MGKKAIFFDIDGTLYDNSFGVSKSTREAISRLNENGHYTFICSGRSRIMIPDNGLLDIGFDGVIAACGTYGEYKNQEIFNEVIPEDIALETIETVKRHQVIPILEGRNNLYFDDELTYNEKATQIRDYIFSLIGEHFQPIRKNLHKLSFNKLSISYEVYEEYEKIKKSLEGYYDYIEHINKDVELVPKGFSKATGIKTICQHLGIKQEDTYSFGDSINDVAMLKYAGVGIAMGNGSDIAKKTADYITKDIKDDGIFHALTHFGLI